MDGLRTIELRVLFDALRKKGVEINEEEKNGIIERIRFKVSDGREFVAEYSPDAFSIDDLLENWRSVGVDFDHRHRGFWITSKLVSKEDVVMAWRSESGLKSLEKRLKHWVFYVTTLIHGGVWVKLGNTYFEADPGGWDTSHCGLIFVSKEVAKRRKKAEEMAEDFVYELNAVLCGEVYILKEYDKNGAEVDGMLVVGEKVLYSTVLEILEEDKQ